MIQYLQQLGVQLIVDLLALAVIALLARIFNKITTYQIIIVHRKTYEAFKKVVPNIDKQIKGK